MRKEGGRGLATGVSLLVLGQSQGQLNAHLGEVSSAIVSSSGPFADLAVSIQESAWKCRDR